MKPQSNSNYGINRLESKTARAAIIQKIASDFNLMPILAEAYYKTDFFLLCPTRRYQTHIGRKVQKRRQRKSENIFFTSPESFWLQFVKQAQKCISTIN